MDALSNLLAVHDRVTASLQSYDFQLPFASFDIRYSSEKLVCVDVNSYPAGFNNLSQASKERLIEKFKAQSLPQNILLIAEDNTRNLKYLENIYVLRHALISAGHDVRVGMVLLDQERTIEADHFTLPLFPITCHENHLVAGGQAYDFALLNSDLITGFPDVFANATATHIVPSVQMGWFRRQKDTFYKHFNAQLDKLEAETGVDLSRFRVYYDILEDFDVNDPQSLKQLHPRAVKVFDCLESCYKKHAIKQRPYLVVKALSGSYGMGVGTIEDPDDILSWNRKQRKALSVTKNKRQVRSVILQEGIESDIRMNDSVAEPCLYSVYDECIGGFYRLNDNSRTNMNRPSTTFVPMEDVSQTCVAFADLVLLALKEEYSHCEQAP